MYVRTRVVGTQSGTTVYVCMFMPVFVCISVCSYKGPGVALAPPTADQITCATIAAQSRTRVSTATTRACALSQ